MLCGWRRAFQERLKTESMWCLFWYFHLQCNLVEFLPSTWDAWSIALYRVSLLMISYLECLMKVLLIPKHLILNRVNKNNYYQLMIAQGIFLLTLALFLLFRGGIHDVTVNTVVTSIILMTLFGTTTILNQLNSLADTKSWYAYLLHRLSIYP